MLIPAPMVVGIFVAMIVEAALPALAHLPHEYMEGHEEQGHAQPFESHQNVHGPHRVAEGEPDGQAGRDEAR